MATPLPAGQASALRRVLQRQPVLAFLLMGVSFLAFGLLSLNLVNTLQANLRMLADHGLMAVMDGALQQLLELMLSGYFSVAFYLLFKACEAVLVERLLTRH